MGHLEIPPQVTAGIRQTQTNRTQVTPLLIHLQSFLLFKTWCFHHFLWYTIYYTTKTPRADCNCHSALSPKSISAFSQNDGADFQTLPSMVSLPVPPIPPCSMGHHGSSPALSVEANSSSGLCPQKGKTQPMLQRGTAGQIPREQGPTLELKALGEQGGGDTIPGLLCCHQERSQSCPGQACGCCGRLGFTPVHKEVTQKINSEMVLVCFHIQEDKDMNKHSSGATILPFWTQKQVTGPAQAMLCALR